MIVVGVSDWPAPAAAVIAEGGVRAWVGGDQVGEAFEGDDPFPWPVVDAALHTAGAARSDVDVVAVAGRFAAPWAVRRSRRLGGLADLAPFREARAAWQLALRATGLGAWTADVHAERLGTRLLAAGFTRARVTLVDAHRALADGGYRTQPLDDVLVVAVQALADGVALSVHRGQGGLLDRLAEQSGAPGMHAHLARVRGALGLDGPEALDALAGRGVVDAQLVAAVRADLHSEGAGLGSDVVGEALVRRLGGVSRADAAAAVVENLAELTAAVVRRQARRAGVRRVVLVGELAELPRVVARVAERGEIASLSVPPRAGRDLLALGAAVGQAGLGPVAVRWRSGPEVAADEVDRVLEGEGWSRRGGGDPAARLAAGDGVVRWVGRAGPGIVGLGERALLVRADDAVALTRVRDAVGAMSPGEADDPWIVVDRAPSGVEASRIGGCLEAGTAAPRVGDVPWAAPDGRARLLLVGANDGTGLADVVRRARELGVGAIAALPLRRPDGSLRRTVAQAAGLFREADLGALAAGDAVVRREDRP